MRVVSPRCNFIYTHSCSQKADDQNQDFRLQSEKARTGASGVCNVGFPSDPSAPERRLGLANCLLLSYYSRFWLGVNRQMSHSFYDIRLDIGRPKRLTTSRTGCILSK
jgi:hypothetical protein